MLTLISNLKQCRLREVGFGLVLFLRMLFLCLAALSPCPDWVLLLTAWPWPGCHFQGQCVAPLLSQQLEQGRLISFYLIAVKQLLS